jgi:uncharacterized membrane protein (DUF485 family)
VKERIGPIGVPVQVEEKNIPYHALIQTQEFKELVKRKKAFILPTTLFFLVFYFTLPLLAAYTKILHTEVIDSIAGAWVFAMLQFILVWVCGWIYVKKSEKYDKLAAEILEKHKEELN